MSAGGWVGYGERQSDRGVGVGVIVVKYLQVQPYSLLQSIPTMRQQLELLQRMLSDVQAALFCFVLVFCFLFPFALHVSVPASPSSPTTTHLGIARYDTPESGPAIETARVE